MSLNQKKLVYHLTEAGLEGRDIMYDQNFRHNLQLRKLFEAIVKNEDQLKDDQLYLF